MDLLQRLAPAQPDALMRAARNFAEDPRPEKVNLSVGIYYDEAGKVPALTAVREAERRIDTAGRPWPYLLPEGLQCLRDGALRVALGDALAASVASRTSVQQTLGGTGAVRLGAEMIAALDPTRIIAVSNPSWPNHEAIFRAVGLPVERYAYHDAATGGLDSDGMLRDLGRLPEGSVVVLHACCHNPTGVDPSDEEWRRIAAVVARRRLVPFLDLAYQGFGAGLESDGAPVRALAATCAPAFLAVSFSKSFCLYGERVGALCTVAPDSGKAAMLGEAGRRIVRTLYSSPPTHGAAVVSRVLSDPVLTQIWTRELDEMRGRVEAMRHGLVERLALRNAPRDFSFMSRQRGLFSYSGLSSSQIARLRDEHAIHAVEDGRLCLSALNTSNIDRVSDAIRDVLTIN